MVLPLVLEVDIIRPMQRRRILAQWEDPGCRNSSKWLDGRALRPSFLHRHRIWADSILQRRRQQQQPLRLTRSPWPPEFFLAQPDWSSWACRG